MAPTNPGKCADCGHTGTFPHRTVENVYLWLCGDCLYVRENPSQVLVLNRAGERWAAERARRGHLTVVA